MPRKPSTTFTDKEMEIMRVIWHSGEATIKQIQEHLPGEPHYNSVLTIVRVLEQKGHLTYRVEGKAHIYKAKVSHKKARRGVISHLVDNVFGGSAISLVLNLIEAGDLSQQDLDEIQKQISEAKNKEKKK